MNCYDFALYFLDTWGLVITQSKLSEIATDKQYKGLKQQFKYFAFERPQLEMLVVLSSLIVW